MTINDFYNDCGDDDDDNGESGDDEDGDVTGYSSKVCDEQG